MHPILLKVKRGLCCFRLIQFLKSGTLRNGIICSVHMLQLNLREGDVFCSEGNLPLIPIANCQLPIGSDHRYVILLLKGSYFVNIGGKYKQMMTRFKMKCLPYLVVQLVSEANEVSN